MFSKDNEAKDAKYFCFYFFIFAKMKPVKYLRREVVQKIIYYVC